ncbi:MAG TPA: phasin family protein [Oligoflexia bacterium]|nr:phasin family protein [Oligoflexia bacterium]
MITDTGENMNTKTKETLDKILGQAKESVKVLELLQHEAVSRAKSVVANLPNEKIAEAFRKMGFATRAEVEALEQKVETLAEEVATLTSKLQQKKSPKDRTKDQESSI